MKEKTHHRMIEEKEKRVKNDYDDRLYHNITKTLWTNVHTRNAS